MNPPQTPLRRARLRSGKTTTAVASEAGVNQSTISRIETGSQTPSPELAATLAEMFGIPEIEILYPERYVDTVDRERDEQVAGA